MEKLALYITLKKYSQDGEVLKQATEKYNSKH